LKCSSGRRSLAELQAKNTADCKEDEEVEGGSLQVERKGEKKVTVSVDAAVESNRTINHSIIPSFIRSFRDHSVATIFLNSPFKLTWLPKASKKLGKKMKDKKESANPILIDHGDQS
jgi:hypothetical protein